MKIYKVGGAVRDELLGLQPTDTDWLVVGSSIKEMAELGYKQVGNNFPVFLHPETNEEYALARREIKSGQGHKDFEFIFTPDVTIEEDLNRRDLTINAMAKDSHGELIDPFNGQIDLKNKVFKHVSDAFYEDPLRALRVARFKAQLPTFDIHGSTKDALKTISKTGELGCLSSERVWAEVAKSLNSKFDQFLNVIKDYDLSEPWFSGIENIPNFKSDIPEIMWCEMAEANNFKFAQHLKIPKTYSKQLAMWKKFSNYRINEDINYKIDFYRDFTNNTYKSATYTLQFFPSIEKECVPIIEEYVNFNFGEIDVRRKNNIDTAKIEELKKIIEKHDK
jgi:tRNA nucleotidyltransferase/poly(A) polymerase